jgi:hypothetical protein
MRDRGSLRLEQPGAPWLRGCRVWKVVAEPPNNGLKQTQDLASLDLRSLGLVRWADDEMGAVSQVVS